MTSGSAQSLSQERIRELDLLIEEATVDAKDEAEQALGLYAMISDNLVLPFETKVLGAAVEVSDIDLTDDDRVVAICHAGGQKQKIDLADLPLPRQRPEGAEWIEAYRRWRGA
jgi:hypothetical protein